MNTYTMLLWAKPNKNNIDAQATQIYRSLCVLSSNNYLKPKYLTAARKKDVSEFRLSIESIKNLILKSKDSIFPDLGSIVSFFTSLNESHSVGITIHIGNANPRFINSIVLDPIILNSYNGTEDYGISYDNLACIFKELIIIFKPFYGCVASSHNLSLYDNNFVNSLNLPQAVYDLNFWGSEIVDRINPDRSFIPNIYEFQRIEDGYYIRLQQEPIDIKNLLHIELQKQANHFLGLNPH